MRAILDKVLWGSLLLLFGPSVMMVASWNALPGDNLYGIKLALERTALTVASPSYATAGTLQIKYTERRYAEAKQLLSSKQSVTGLPYLQQQIAQTKKAIEHAPNKETQVALAKQYIDTLVTVSTQLEQQKQEITNNPQPIAYVPPNPTVDLTPTSTPPPAALPTSMPTPIQIAQVTTTTSIPTGQAVVALQIDQTQQNVDQTIAELQAFVDEDNHDRDDRRDREGDKEQKEKNERNRRGEMDKKGKRDKDNDR